MKVLNAILALLGVITLALAAPAVPQADSPPKEKCPSGRQFCVHSPWTDKIFYCHLDGRGFDVIHECAADEYCAGRPDPDEQDPTCKKQTTTIYPTTTPWKTSSAPWPNLPEVPSLTATADSVVPRQLIPPTICGAPMVFCVNFGDKMSMEYCRPGMQPRTVHQCAAGERCVATVDNSKHNADLHCAKEGPAPGVPRISLMPSDLPTAIAFAGVPDAPKVYCDGQKIMYSNHKAAPEVVHTCGTNEYCTGNDDPWEGRIQLYCQREDPLVSTPGHSHLISPPTPTSTAEWEWTPSSHKELPPRRTAPAKPLPAEVVSALDNFHNGTADASVSTSDYYCGHCINMQGKTSGLYGINWCNNLPEGEEYRACANEWCGLCVVYRGRDCDGDMIHWGGPNEGSYDATGAQSHWCI